MLQYKEKFLAWFSSQFGMPDYYEAWLAGYQLGVKEERSRDKNLKDKYDH